MSPLDNNRSAAFLKKIKFKKIPEEISKKISAK